MIAGRREVLAGIGALTFAQPAYAQDITAALDEAATLPPARGLARLAGLRATTLAARLDLGAARIGLPIDAMLAARFPSRVEQRAALTALRDKGTPGAARLPNGTAYLLLELRRPLGDAMTLDGAEARLQRELLRLRNEADRRFAGLGLTTGPTGTRFRRLFADSDHLYPDDATGRDRAVADMNRTLAQARVRTPKLIGPLSSASSDVAVRSLSTADIAAGRGGYREQLEPGRPGAYVVDLQRIAERPRWTLPSVVAHELLPGHMVQLPVEALTPPHPLRRTYAGAFSEGWAIYAETLGGRIGLYPTALEQLGHLHWLLFRVGRGLIDLRLHRGSFTLAQARAALEHWQGPPAYFAPYDTELARVAVEPGIRAGEALAWLALADRARGLTGRRLIAFHQAVLAGGRKRLEQLP